ncbi:Ribonuclease 3-like protein 2 [Capsicum annuum]|nr:Ribonuclease 3-like protein 2 [Capsicum annuum]
MEQLLKYQFKNRKLLEEALTHSSYPNSSSINYQRLAFIGDASLSLAISSYFFVTYPEIDCGKLTDLRAVNVSTEKLARVAVRHGLYNYLRRDSAVLDEKYLAFIGDAALSLAISSYFFVTYPEIDCGKLTDLRAINVSTEKLARVAVRHGLYNYLCRDSSILDEKVR